jgi:opacity protein-like surface antigen
MKTRSLLLVSAIAILTATGAQAQGWNFSIMGGSTWSPNLPEGAGPLRAVDNGFNAGGRLGYDLDDWTGFSGLSADLDTFYTQSDYTGRQSRLSSLSFMGDLIYHVDLGLPVGVYGGAGVGGVRTMLNTQQVDSGGTVFAWQALGGIDYHFSPDTTVFAEYRYQDAHDANVGTIPGVGYRSNNVSVGLKFAL